MDNDFSLNDVFRAKVSKLKDYRSKAEADCGIMYSTGYLSFDFLNGQVVHIKSDKLDVEKYYSVGLGDGSLNTFIGRSGCGKSTLAESMAANIVRSFPNAMIYEDQVEATGMTDERRQSLSGFYGEEYTKRYNIRNSGITAENFYERIKIVHDLKLANREELEYDTGLYDTIGNKIYKLQPTVFILDSLAMLMPEKFTTEDDLSGSMSASASAKVIAGIFRRIVPMLKAANIILFVINHINHAISINPMVHEKAQLGFLKQGETLPGGNTPVYVSTNVLRLDDHSKMKDTEGFYESGNLVDVTLVKSRTSSVGRKVTLVYTYERGFDKELSLFLMLKQYGHVNGAGAYLYIDDYDKVKFAQKNFKKILKENEEFRQVFMNAVFDVLTNDIIIDNYVETEAEDTTIDITSQLLSRIQIAA